MSAGAATRPLLDPAAVRAEADRLVRLGVSVIPLEPGGKEPAVVGHDALGQPIRFPWGPYADRIADASERYEWFDEKGWQVGVTTGAASTTDAGHLVILDFDGLGGYEAHAAQYPILRTFPRVRTGSGKAHVYVRTKRPTEKYVTKAADGSRLEVRAGNHYCVAPPSLHPATGRPYIWEVEPWGGISPVELSDLGLSERRPDDDYEPTPLSEGEPLTPAEIKAIAEAVRPHYRPQQKHDLSLALCGWLVGYTVPEADAWAILEEVAEPGDNTANLKRNLRDTYTKARAGKRVAGWSRLNDAEDRLVSVETAAKLQHLLRHRIATINPLGRPAAGGGGSQDMPTGDARPAPANRPPTDLGNAERLVDRYGATLRYCEPWNDWLTWTGKRWMVDDTGTVARCAKLTVRSIGAEASALDDDERRTALLKHAARSEAQGRIAAMVTLATTEAGIPIRPGDLDRDDWLFNAANGTIDLRTGELLPHRRAHLLTKMAPVAHDPAAGCPTWEATLARVLPDAAVRTFLQRLTGYGLTGSNREQVVAILWGGGQNGKSTILGTLHALFGDYATEADPKTFIQQKYEGVRDDLADLKGARLVCTTELSEGQRLNESLVKRMTGGEKIKCRKLYGDLFEYVPQFKVLMATNHKPVIRGTDHAIWRRLRLIPFTVTIPKDEQDKRLGEKLVAELPGILAWAVRGCLDWQRDGLGEPEAVTEATSEYRAEQDVLGAFLADRCALEPTASVAGQTLYQAYRAWCEEVGEHPMNNATFALRVLERPGIDRTRLKAGIFYLGLRLRVVVP